MAVEDAVQELGLYVEQKVLYIHYSPDVVMIEPVIITEITTKYDNEVVVMVKHPDGREFDGYVLPNDLYTLEGLMSWFVANPIEKLAEIEHKQWSHWTKHLLAKFHPLDDKIDDEDIRRWKKQAEMSYDELPEEDKEKDRTWARIAISKMDGGPVDLDKDESPDGEIDISLIATGKRTNRRIFEIIQDLQYKEGFCLDDIMRCAEEKGITRKQANADIEQLKNEGLIYEDSEGKFKIV